MLGKVIRFDEVRGYGFIAPTGGGEDVFVHVNSLGEERYRLAPGVPVEFEVCEGDRGLKAFDVRIVPPDHGSPATAAIPNGSHQAAGGQSDVDALCDVLPAAELSRELTESLLRTVATLTAAQVLNVRQCVLEIAGKYGWIEN